MKVSRLVAQAARPDEPIVAPSPVHVALVEVMGQMTSLALRGGHPAAKLLQKLAPSILKDIAEIPAETLRKVAGEWAGMMEFVAHAPLDGEVVVPDFETRVEAIASAGALEALPAGEPQPL